MTALLQLVGGGGGKTRVRRGAICTSRYSAAWTRKIGTLLGRGLTFGQAMGSAGRQRWIGRDRSRTDQSIRIARRRGVRQGIGLPAAHAVDDIINHGAVDIPWDEFVR
jgi:glycerol-3-phosphate dehydrogenase (NAD(P)+)